MKRILHDYGLVRVVGEGSPFDRAYDVWVEYQENLETEWLFFQGFNTLSDDYAYTNARDAAGRCVKNLAKKYAEKYTGV